MGILDGLQELFGEVFGDVFPDGTLHKQTLVDDGKGGYSSTQVDHPIKVLVESCSEEQRADPGYTELDVSLIILQYLVAAALTSDDEVTANSLRWKINTPIRQDPVKAAWIARGTPA